MEAGIVLAYQDEEWLTAVNDQGTWRGTLTEIVGGYGYWVQTTAFESISTLIPETDTSSVLPTARVIKGWNLLGVVDVQQAAAGKAPSGNGEADDYFNNFDWRVAYAFNTCQQPVDQDAPGRRRYRRDSKRQGLLGLEHRGQARWSRNRPPGPTANASEAPSGNGGGFRLRVGPSFLRRQEPRPRASYVWDRRSCEGRNLAPLPVTCGTVVPAEAGTTRRLASVYAPSRRIVIPSGAEESLGGRPAVRQRSP